MEKRRSVRRKKRNFVRRGKKKREKKRGISRQDGKRLYYTCLGAFSLRLREQDEKARTSLGPSSTYSTNKDGCGYEGGEVGGTPWYPKRGGGVLTLR